MAGRILIASRDVEERTALSSLLRAARYEAIAVPADEDLREAALEAAPDLILLDGGLDGRAGIDVCRKLKADPALRNVPIILSAESYDTVIRRDALESGADELLRKPYDEVVLMARLRSTLRLGETSDELRRRRSTAGEFGFAECSANFMPPGRIAFVTSDAARAQSWSDGLSSLIRHRTEVLAPDAALDSGASGRAPDLFVIDLATGGAPALRLVPELRSRAPTRHAAIVVICPVGDADCMAMALDLGANDLVPADFDFPELAIRLRTQLRRKRESDALRAAVDEELRMAVIDPLTGLYNRRYAMAHLARLAERAADGHRSFTVMIADLDHFKSINDRFGHGAGDAVLVEVARRFRENLRGNDLIARIGGEEFLIVLPDCELAEAQPAGERLCRLLNDAPVALPNGAHVHVTVSIGIALGGDSVNARSVEDVISAADRALYASKSMGRNRAQMGLPAA